MVRDWNQVDRATGRRPLAGFLQYRYYDTSESSHYHGWQTSLRKRVSQGLAVNLHYTFSNNISYNENDLLLPSFRPQDNGNLRPEKGLVPFDVRHRMLIDYVYELPLAQRLSSAGRASSLLLSGWQIAGIFSAETGAPLTLDQPSSIPGSRPDYIDGEAILSDSRKTLRYLNPAAFRTVPLIQASGATARPGTVGRGFVRGHGAWTLDLALSKNLALTERFKLQIRADMFNSFNHANLSGVSTNITAGTFGRFTSTRGARTVQLNARLTF
jgi:hypothetical protein